MIYNSSEIRGNISWLERHAFFYRRGLFGKVEQICRKVTSSIEEEVFIYYHAHRVISCIVQVRSLKNEQSCIEC